MVAIKKYILFSAVLFVLKSLFLNALFTLLEGWELVIDRKSTPNNEVTLQNYYMTKMLFAIC